MSFVFILIKKIIPIVQQFFIVLCVRHDSHYDHAFSGTELLLIFCLIQDNCQCISQILSEEYLFLFFKKYLPWH